MTQGEVALILFGSFAVLITLRVPVAFALGLACVPIFFVDDRLSPILLITEMTKAYNAFVLLAVPFFILAANLMNSSGITQRLIELSRAMVGHFKGGLGHINVVVSMIFAGISGSSTADAAGIGSVLIPAMRKQGYDTSFTVAITCCSSVMGVIVPPSILMIVWGGDHERFHRRTLPRGLPPRGHDRRVPDGRCADLCRDPRLSGLRPELVP